MPSISRRAFGLFAMGSLLFPKATLGNPNTNTSLPNDKKRSADDWIQQWMAAPRTEKEIGGALDLRRFKDPTQCVIHYWV